MKRAIFATEFVVILLFFVLPPIVFAQKLPAVRVVHFGWITFALAAFAAALWWQTRGESIHRLTQMNTDDGKVRFLLHQGQCLVTFGLLVAIAGGCELLGRFVLHVPEQTQLLPPTTALGWVNVFCGTLCAAFYEEVLYRVYLPAAMKMLFSAVREKGFRNIAPVSGTASADASGRTTSKAVPLACEACTVVLFALAHRYAGWLAVANAAVGGALLRRCYCKTGALWTNVAAHTAYNAVMLAIALA